MVHVVLGHLFSGNCWQIIYAVVAWTLCYNFPGYKTLLEFAVKIAVLFLAKVAKFWTFLQLLNYQIQEFSNARIGINYSKPLIGSCTGKSVMGGDENIPYLSAFLEIRWNCIAYYYVCLLKKHKWEKEASMCDP